MKPIVGTIVAALTLVSMMPLLDTALKIEWTTYLGIALIIFSGSAGTACVTKRFEAIIGGALLSALWPVVFAMILRCL